MLRGRTDVLTDVEHKKMPWREGIEIYYPQGVTDEDYYVLKFTLKKVIIIMDLKSLILKLKRY